MTIKQAKKIGAGELNWSQKVALARRYSYDRLFNPQRFSISRKSVPGGFVNLDRIVADLLV
jgi:hypothetical protein